MSRSRSRRSICSSIRGRQVLDSLAQSALVGVLPSGSPDRASSTSSKVSPTRWADRMKATRRSVAEWYLRWLPVVRSEVISPLDS